MIVSSFAAHASDDLNVDFRFKPALWNTAINLPDDWQKTLVSESGAFLFEYPGPISKFKTVVSAGIAGVDLKTTNQRLLNEKTPIVLTTSEASGTTLNQQAFAIVDSPFKISNLPKPKLYRVGRELTVTEWAQPPQDSDPAFEHAALGQQQPIHYAYDVQANDSRTVAVGLIEGYYNQTGQRVLEVEVEGAPVRTIDTFAMSGHNKPLVVFFDGQDKNSDGRINIEVRPSANSPQKDTVLSALWILPKGQRPQGNKVSTKNLTATAEAYVSCGVNPDLHTFNARRDVLRLEYAGGNFQPVVRIRTTRSVSVNITTGVVSLKGRPFLISNPAPITSQTQNGQTVLIYAKSLPVVDLVFVNGPDIPASALQPVNVAQERTRAVNFWANTNLPYNRIQVPDAGIQKMLDSSVRNIFQARDIKGGKAEFRVGPTVYRDIWLVDGSFLLETAVQLGVVDEARRAIDRILEYQTPSGQVIVLQPDFYKETGITLWILQRHARLTQDKAWLEARWKHVTQGVKWIKAIRKIASRNPSAPYAGLIPPGHPDGGIAGPKAEYTNVFWTLNGLKAAIEAAKWLGKTDEASDWQREYDDFMATFQRAAQRDMRKDSLGNKYLPILMNPGPNDLPQKGQWGFLHAIFPGKVLATDDPIATGTLAMLDANNSEGLVLSTGWMTGGIWTYFGSFYGHAHLWLGGAATNGAAHIKKAQEILYAFANHASPLLVWREEQQPVGQGLKMVGDMPHNWASAEFIRLVRHMIAIERDENLVLFQGIPAKWLQLGKELSLNKIATEFGELSLRARVSSDGQSAVIEVDKINSASEAGSLVIDLRVFKQLGFKLPSGAELPDFLPGAWGKNLTLKLQK